MRQIGVSIPDGLHAGDASLEAQQITVTGPAELKRGDVVAFSDNETIVLAESTRTDGGQHAVGIMCHDVRADEGEAITTTMYVKGAFNQRRLRFGGADTIEKHLRRMTEIGLIVRESRV